MSTPFHLPQRHLSEIRESLQLHAQEVRERVSAGELKVQEARRLLQEDMESLENATLQESEWTREMPSFLRPRICSHGGGDGFCLQCGRALCDACQADNRCAICSGPLRDEK